MTIREFCAKYNVPARIAASALSMPVTSTPSFEDHRITKYGGYVLSKMAFEISDWFFGNGDFNNDLVIAKLERIESTEIDKLKIAVAQRDCNALVDLKFNYLTLDRDFVGVTGRAANRTFIVVNASGTAVTVEPIST